MENYFNDLNAVNVSDKVEKKNNLSYLSWAFAWGEIKKRFPDANYKVYERDDGCIYWTDGKTAWVKTGVTVNGIEHIEYLPVMDFRNNSIPLEKITSFDVNKTIQRSLTKACARHGLGLYIYAGEDLPEENKELVDDFKKDAVAQKKATTKAIRQAIDEGKEYTEPTPQKPLKERFDNAMQWLKSQTPETYRNAAKSYKDAINALYKELHDKGVAGWHEEMSKEFDRVTSIDDEIKY